MLLRLLLLFVVSVFWLCLSGTYSRVEAAKNTNEWQAIEFLHWFETEVRKSCHAERNAWWNFANDITVENKEKKVAAELTMARFMKSAWQNASQFDWQSFKNPYNRRQFKVLSTLLADVLPDQDFILLKNTVSEMERIYSTRNVCDFRDPDRCSLKIEPEIENIMADSRDYEELLFTWRQWHDGVGKPTRQLYPTYVKLKNEVAKLNGFKDAGALWRNAYETDNLEEMMASIWEQMRPFYFQLHAYVRTKLRKFYGGRVLKKDGCIPAHLVGSMWAQSWSNIEDIVKPFPLKSSADATPEMERQGYTTYKMFRMAESFFTSMGLSPMPKLFWSKSVMERPKDRDIVCHASAWDFCNGQDFRIKMCATVNMENLIAIHHEMGHIQYYMAMKDLPYLLRNSANPGFHEAIGDTLVLSVSTSQHLRLVGLLPDSPDDEGLIDLRPTVVKLFAVICCEQTYGPPEVTLNDLMRLALQKVAFLPFAYIMDLWRWKVFRGEITEQNYNREWWKLRHDFQGIESVSARSEDHFDPGAKYHVVADFEYLRYFVSEIIQFQFHRSLCEEAGQYEPGNPEKPLHKCDIYGNLQAGKLLSSMLKMGATKPWPDAMAVITKNKSRNMDASAMIEYFQPLMHFLSKENRKNRAELGWKDCTSEASQAPIRIFLLLLVCCVTSGLVNILSL